MPPVVLGQTFTELSQIASNINVFFTLLHVIIYNRVCKRNVRISVGNIKCLHI